MIRRKRAKGASPGMVQMRRGESFPEDPTAWEERTEHRVGKTGQKGEGHQTLS